MVIRKQDLRAGRVTQVVEHLPSKVRSWVQTQVLPPHPKKKKEKKTGPVSVIVTF
jgi:hypothetical protein